MNKNTIVDDIWAKQLVWFGHLQRIDEERLPRKILNLTPTGRGKRETKNKIERRLAGRCERMWCPRRKLLGQTALEIGCRETLPCVI
jgi:hypothetical protein